MKTKYEQTLDLALSPDGTTPEEVAAKLGISLAAARSMLSDVRRRGYDVRIVDGTYIAKTPERKVKVSGAPQKWKVALALASRRKGVSKAEIADVLEVDPKFAGGYLSDLRTRGYRIERKRDRYFLAN